MTFRGARWIPVAAVLLAGGAVAPASASHIAGVRVTPAGMSGPTVWVDITVFYHTTATQKTARLGRNPHAAPSGLDNSAIIWGPFPERRLFRAEGLELVSSNTVVNGIPVRAYKGSFIHTYGDVGTYTITTATNFEEGIETPLATGNLDFFYSTGCGTGCLWLFSWATNTTVVEVTEAPLFVDGFESGDFSGWSATNPPVERVASREKPGL